MNANWLWLYWAIFAFGGFAVLEFLALREKGGLEPLTYWVRAGISASPALIGAGLFVGFSWLTFHFLMEPSIRGWKRGKTAGRRAAARIRRKRGGR